MALKKATYRFFALGMVFCYMLNLFQYQLPSLLHSISHTLEVPDYVMVHDNSTMVSSQEHGHDDHGFELNAHEHSIIDFIGSILDDSGNDNGNDETIVNLIKFDKHLSYYEIFKVPLSTFFYTLPRNTKANGVLKGFLPNFKIPPQTNALS